MTRTKPSNVLRSRAALRSRTSRARRNLRKKVEEAKNKIAELMANTDTMKVRIADYEQQVTEKDAELEKQKQEIEDLKEKLETAEANAGTATPCIRSWKRVHGSSEHS